MVDLKNLEFYKNVEWKEEKINGRKFLFPIDWNLDILKNILKGNTGFTPPTNNESNFIGNTKWINISDMNQKYIESKKCLNDNISNIKNKKLDKDSLLFSFKLSIGKVGFTKFDNMVTNEAIIGYSPKNNSNLKFYYYAMPKYTILNTGKNAFGMDLMNIELIENSKMILPNIEEQEKIASILETQEELLNSKKELLSKYKKQRKYFQQELLSGRIRIRLNQDSLNIAISLGLIDNNEIIETKKEEFEIWLNNDFENKIEFYKNVDFKEEKINARKFLFPIDWNIDFLKNILKGNTGFTPPTNNESNFIGDTKWINISDMNQKYIGNKKYLNDNIPNIKNKKLDKGSLLFSFKLSIGKVGFTKFDNMVTNEAIIGYSPKNNSNLNFYYYAMPIYTVLNTGKNAFGMDLMNIELIENSKMILPTNIEKYFIATQLTKSDELIDSLEKDIKLEDKKFTYLKQELLSGRIRVN
jgi:type I restriction enzyme S subunit